MSAEDRDLLKYYIATPDVTMGSEKIEDEEVKAMSIGENTDTASINVDGIQPTTQHQDAVGNCLSKTSSKCSNVLARVTSRLTTRSIIDPGPPPDGGIVAWTQVLCAWFAILNSWGFVNSFGAFQAYYESILPEPASAISWIGSIQACLMFAVGMFSGRALDRGWFRPTVAVGIAIQLLGIFALSWAKTYWQFLLTQGLCTGIGGGIFFVPIMGLCSTYFSKKRGMALGIVTCGNSAGGIIYPVIVRQLLPKIGFGWTVRILGFINVASLAIVLAFMKPRLPPRKSGPLIEWVALRDRPYCLHVLGMCFLMPPIYCVFYYIASYARDTLSMPYTASLNLVIILNGVGLPARILPGFLADRYLGVLNTLTICLFFNILILFTWLSVSSIPRYYAWTVVYGMFAAAFQSLFPTTIAAYSPDIAKTGTRLGMAFGVIGLSALVGGPIAGALLKASGGDYRVPICWAGASTVVGTGLCVSARCLKFGWKVWVRC
ncbi:MFS general substrate transporter [Clathrospora elynae]|uniref:MFS general substrate transporter n=1 Tax=Clathrospora elynae TaxID=706981 RepID=A0A6A5SPV6_9PLEO|nr:MFS general substrate transporter [Clathrospora elynae]